MSTVVQVEGLTKTYDGGFEALKNVSLDIKEGEILALLGPNGAGKTTLISTICGITSPTSGRITVGGHDCLLYTSDAADEHRDVGWAGVGGG